MTKTITIIAHADGHFTVLQDDLSVANMLAWDEMLGEIAQLTHPKLGGGRYSVHIDSHIARMEWHAKCRREREQRLTPETQPDRKETD